MQDRDELAEKIADAILNESVMGEADRIVLIRGWNAQHPIDLGGLCRTALIRVIGKTLAEGRDG